MPTVKNRFQILNLYPKKTYIKKILFGAPKLDKCQSLAQMTSPYIIYKYIKLSPH